MNGIVNGDGCETDDAKSNLDSVLLAGGNGECLQQQLFIRFIRQLFSSAVGEAARTSRPGA